MSLQELPFNYRDKAICIASLDTPKLRIITLENQTIDQRFISNTVRTGWNFFTSCIIASCFKSLFSFTCHLRLNYLYNLDYFEMGVHCSRLALLGSQTMTIHLTIQSMMKLSDALVLTD